MYCQRLAARGAIQMVMEVEALSSCMAAIYATVLLVYNDSTVDHWLLIISAQPQTRTNDEVSVFFR